MMTNMSVADKESEWSLKYKLRMNTQYRTAVRAHCVECMGGNFREVPDCTNKQCALYLFRNGTVRPTKDELDEWKESLSGC